MMAIMGVGYRPQEVLWQRATGQSDELFSRCHPSWRFRKSAMEISSDLRGGEKITLNFPYSIVFY